MRRHLFHRVGTLLAAVALLVAPLRATIACDMGGPAPHPADVADAPPAVASHEVSAAAHAVHAAHAAHSGHVTPAVVPAEPAAQHPSAFSSEHPSPDHSAPHGPMPAPCDDLASCAVVALPPSPLERATVVTAPAAPRIATADAPTAPAAGVEPPPPRA